MQADRLNSALSGRYDVQRELGSGGMASVFLAHDPRHDRDVAIKVLHPELGAALGGERFLAEIKTTARLQHPHILPLLDSGEADGLLFYVMPVVEGETLRARLEREGQLPIDTAVRITSEVASALDYAHRHGVIHRDIKPENILLHDGRALVADFGIALAVSAASGTRMTQTGLSLGTPQYMAPEQAMGEKQIDARADIYALGAVLYELLTGDPPFTGATVHAIVAKVLTERPMSPTSVRDTIPRHIEATVLKSLAKLPADRFASAAEFSNALAHPEATQQIEITRGGPTTPRRTWIASVPLAYTLAALATVLAIWGWTRNGREQASASPEIRAILPTVNNIVPAILGAGALLAISNDGSRIVFTGADSTNIVKLFVQTLSEPTVTPVPNSNFSNGPFFSPDGESIGFGSSGRLRTLSLKTGATRSLAPLLGGLTACWGPDGTIVYTFGNNLYRVAAAGGEPRILAEVPNDRTAYRMPSFAGDRQIVLTITTDSAPELATLSLDDGKVRQLGIQGRRPFYLQGGVLAYLMEDGGLWAVDFDARRGRVTGAPRLAFAAGVGNAINARLATAPNGMTVLMTGTVDDRELVLLDRAGRATVTNSGKRAYRYPRFSPDGRMLAFGLVGSRGPSSGDIWTLDLSSNTMLRVTTDSLSYHPEWTSDGKSLVYYSRTDTGVTVRSTPADGSAQARTLFASRSTIWESNFTPDGKTMLVRTDGTTTLRDIYTVSLDSAAPRLVPLQKTNFDESGIALSPDGRWMAYTSNESGPQEVYVRRLEPNSPRWRLSRNGGSEPRWRGSEIFFRSRDSVFVSRVVTGPVPTIGEPKALFGGRYDASTFEPLYDVSRDGQRFVVVRPGRAQNQMQIVVGWLERFMAARR